jgi:hypothetical protein
MQAVTTIGLDNPDANHVPRLNACHRVGTFSIGISRQYYVVSWR